MSLPAASFATPAHFVLPAEEHALKADLKNRLTAALQKGAGNIQSPITVRDLVASDLVSGLTRLQNGNSTSLSKTAFTSLFSSAPALTNKQAIAIYGYQTMQVSPAPLIDVLKWYLGSGGTPIGQTYVGRAYGDSRLATVFFEPLIWFPLDTLDVQAIANGTVAQNSETFNFVGLIAEPQGTTYTPRDIGNLVPQA
jgi:hypothetical protein